MPAVDFYKVEFSAETIADARTILDALLGAQLVTGGQFIESPARFMWKGNVVELNYVITTSYTTSANLDAISALVERVSKEEVPVVAFVALEVNTKFGAWIATTVRSSTSPRTE